MQYRTPSPRRSRRYTNSMDTPTAPQSGYEDVVRLLETVASATLGERNLTDTYEARIRDLEAENAELLKGLLPPLPSPAPLLIYPHEANHLTPHRKRRATPPA